MFKVSIKKHLYDGLLFNLGTSLLQHVLENPKFYPQFYDLLVEALVDETSNKSADKVK